MNNNIKFCASTVRAYRNDAGKMFIEGIASSDSIDTYRTIFSRDCQEKWKRDLEAGLPTYIEVNHDGLFDWTKRIGKVVDMWSTENTEKSGITNFGIRAELDGENPNANIVFNAITNPKTEYGQPENLGLSINFEIIDWHFERVDKEAIQIFDEVRLKLIGVVEHPSNPDTFVGAFMRNLSKEEVQEKMDKIEKNEKVATRMENEDEKKTDEEIVKLTVEEVGKMLNELISTINAISAADLTPNNILYAIESFISKYNSDIVWNVIDEAAWEIYKNNRSKLNDGVNGKANDEVNGGIRGVDEKNCKTNVEEKNINDKTDREIEMSNVEKKVEETKVEVQPEVREEAKVDETKVDAKVEEVREEKVEVKDETRDALATILSEMKLIRDENKALKEEMVNLRNKPVSTPASQVPAEVREEATLSREDILELMAEGKLNRDTEEFIREIQLKEMFGINK